VVIVAFAILNAAAIAFLVHTVARGWGLLYAATLGAFLIIGPDAFYSAWVWHPSLYTAAVALMLAAGIRLRDGSVWWATTLVAIPGLYALIHYSGFVLFAPALALALLSRRTWSSLLAPAITGLGVMLIVWVPFLAFETNRNWRDLRGLTDAADDSSTLWAKLEDRLRAVGFALANLGEPLQGRAHLTTLIFVMTIVAFVFALSRGRWRDPGFALPAAMLGSGLGTQIFLDQGSRRDVLMIWDVPLYALAAWALVQTVGLARRTITSRSAGTVVAVVVITAILAVGTIDRANEIRSVPHDLRLHANWSRARALGPIEYDAAVDPVNSENRHYLPCDPPYDWGSEVWYLQEVLEPGSGLAAAIRAGAFRARAKPACDR
jgi:hypothetical protein